MRGLAISEVKIDSGVREFHFIYYQSDPAFQNNLDGKTTQGIKVISTSVIIAWGNFLQIIHKKELGKSERRLLIQFEIANQRGIMVRSTNVTFIADTLYFIISAFNNLCKFVNCVRVNK